MNITIADLHCHPTMKPYGRSFPNAIAASDPHFFHCIYHYDNRPFVLRLTNKLFGITKFSQANMLALKKGGVGLIYASLYPFEKGFAPKTALPGDLVSAGVNLVTGIGLERIHSIQNPANGYFEDLLKEYAFLKAMDGQIIEIGGENIKYVLLKNFNQLSVSDPNVFTIYIGLSFEGAHAFYNNFADIGLDSDEVEASLLSNVEKVKRFEHPPLFITFAHHFYNGFCGHAASLTDFPVRLIANQRHMLGAGLNSLGRRMIKSLLDTSNGKRILIDIKHMSIKAREEYFQLLDAEYQGANIPLIVSHGAVSGREEQYNVFLSADINFSDAEIVRVGKSRGLFGIQLDERRIASSHEIDVFKSKLGRERILTNAALFVWRQIHYIAVLLDINLLPAWDVQCLGSDNDGIVNPIDGIWTSEDFGLLRKYLLPHAQEYVANPDYHMDLPENLISAEMIVEKFMATNMITFLRRNFA